MNNLAGILSTVSIILFALSAAALIVAVILFFYFRIPKVYGDLSGKTARKSIKQIREGNEKSGPKSHRPSKTNEERGMLTETASSGEKRAAAPQKAKASFAPAKASSEKAASGAEPSAEQKLSNRIYYENSDDPQTGILSSNKAEQDAGNLNETSLLKEESEETTLLSESEETVLLEENAAPGRVIVSEKEGGINLEIIDEVMLIHTNEVI